MSSLASTFLKPTQGDLSNYVLIHPIPPAVWAVGAQPGYSDFGKPSLNKMAAITEQDGCLSSPLSLMITSPPWNQQVEDWEKRQQQLQESPHLTTQSPELFLKAPPNSSGGEKVKHFNFPVSAVANN